MANVADSIVELSALPWGMALEQLLPPQGQWSEEEYLVLTDHSNKLVEFTDGYLQFLPMPTDEHQAILAFLFLAFHSHVEARGGKVRFAPLRLKIRKSKYREPDLLLQLRGDDERRQNRIWIGADLVLEVVSDDDPDRDLVEKPRDYAEARIPEYWIVHPREKTIKVLRLDGDHYVEAGIYRRGEVAKSWQIPDLVIDVAQALDAK